MYCILFMTAFFGRNRVVSCFAPRMAAQNPFDTQIGPIKQAMGFEGFHEVVGAGRLKPATGRGKG